MPIIEYDTYKQKLGAMEPELTKLAAALDLDNAKAEIAKLEKEQADENFWSDLENSQKVLQRTKQLQHKVDKHAKLMSQWEDLTTLVEMAIEEEDDSLLEEISQGYAALESAVEEANLDTLLSGEYDNNNAILNFHAGAGGTEAQDWAQMLYRMYMRWAERHDFKFETIDYLDGDEAGIKSASVIISGENAYGYQYGDVFDRAELKYQNDSFAVTAGYGKFKEGDIAGDSDRINRAEDGTQRLPPFLACIAD